MLAGDACLPLISWWGWLAVPLCQAKDHTTADICSAHAVKPWQKGLKRLHNHLLQQTILSDALLFYCMQGAFCKKEHSKHYSPSCSLKRYRPESYELKLPLCSALWVPVPRNLLKEQTYPLTRCCTRNTSVVFYPYLALASRFPSSPPFKSQSFELLYYWPLFRVLPMQHHSAICMPLSLLAYDPGTGNHRARCCELYKWL